jgi:hypothetical protein
MSHITISNILIYIYHLIFPIYFLFIINGSIFIYLLIQLLIYLIRYLHEILRFTLKRKNIQPTTWRRLTSTCYILGYVSLSNGYLMLFKIRIYERT